VWGNFLNHASILLVAGPREKSVRVRSWVAKFADTVWLRRIGTKRLR